MATKKDFQGGKRRHTLMGLLAISALNAGEASRGITQHRVRPTERHVDYQHVLENRRRSTYEKFWIPSVDEYVANRRNLEERNLIHRLTERSRDENDRGTGAWTLKVQGGNQGPGQRRSRLLAQKDASMGNYLRRLFDQFIGQESYEYDDSNLKANATNVTAEVSNSTANETYVYTIDESSNSTANETESEDLQFRPLRITAYLDDVEGRGDLLTEAEQQMFFVDILSPALVSWSNSLRVDPVVGNLTVDVEQLLDGETCGPGLMSGLPSIRVPRQHLVQGIPDTDMVLYLSLDFVIPRVNQTNSTMNQTDTETRDSEELDELDRRLDGSSEIQSDLSGDVLSYAQNATLEAEEEPSAGRICNGDNLAAASFCSTDQYDRPTAALLHLCIDEGFFAPEKRNRNILTLMHEIGHALGFNSVSMAHFRKTDGTPLTERVNGAVPEKRIECSGPQAERRFAKVPLPSEEILQFREVRGGVRVAEIVTPSVVQVVKNQFDCQGLTGAELESGEGLILSSEEDGFGCVGDHWERRLFSNDLMNPVIDDLEYYPRVSTLTLAYFADSGWYQVDLSGSRVASGWGRGAGCGFANETCIGQNGEVPPHNAPFFCNEVPLFSANALASQVNGCTPDLTRKATCSMGRYVLDLPWEYQYFHDTYGSDVGGKDALMDYCPVYRGYENGLCANPATKFEMQASSVERFGERNSRCLIGSLNSWSASTALCLPIACVMEDRSLRVKVGKTWRRCVTAGQVLEEDHLVLECPDPIRVCPTFYCPFDCLGTGGQCDYLTGKCMCEYQSIFDEDETVARVCGSEEEEENQNSGVFLRPITPTQIFPVIPHPDSPFSEYYVSTERELNDSKEQELPVWIWILGGIVCTTLLSTVGFYVWGKNQRGDDWYAAWFQQPSDELALPTPQPPINRNKDKMIATVLVDLRIRGNSGENQSLAATEEQLTESEASQALPSESMSDFSGPGSVSFSVQDEQDDESHDDDNEIALEEAQVMRRRKAAR